MPVLNPIFYYKTTIKCLFSDSSFSVPVAYPRVMVFIKSGLISYVTYDTVFNWQAWWFSH